jgi:bifunctional non-homologous end joining protein LigD
MPLSEYKRKRNFAKTPEPKSGAKRKPGAQPLRFCVQKHRASHLHYDFRLELDGVLKSWAVPKGPSLNPQDKRLAMMVEDHPLSYMTFEGEIPKGQYGAGQVIVWDIGVYASAQTADIELWRKKLKSGLFKGEIKFVLAGKKLKGAFALIKIKNSRDKKDNAWLLIKEKDQYAKKTDITAKNTSVLSRKKL